ncbi:hypothetical protein MBLNU457_5557t1 [Dothideomycetes sp. NU457]
MASNWFFPRRLRAALFQSFTSIKNATRSSIQAIRFRQAAIFRGYAATVQPLPIMRAPCNNSSSSPKRHIDQVDIFSHINERPSKRRSPSPPENTSRNTSAYSTRKRPSVALQDPQPERPAKRRSPSPDPTKFRDVMRRIYAKHGPLGVLPKDRSFLPVSKPITAPIDEATKEETELLASLLNDVDYQVQEEQEEAKLRLQQENARREKQEEREREQEALREARRAKEEKEAAIKAAKHDKKKRLNAKARKLEREASQKSLQESLAEYHAWLETVNKRFEDVSLVEGKEAAAEEKEVVEEEVKPPFLAALSDEWERKVVEALAVRAETRIMGKSMDGIEFSRKDIARLLPRGEMLAGQEPWLNDEVVNAWYANLCARLNEKAGYVKSPTTVPKFVAYNSQWLKTATDKGITGIQTWSRRKGIKNEKLLQAERIFFPVNTGAHWTLLTISPLNKSIEYLDSLNPHGFNNTKFTNLARQWLKMELGSKFNDDEWTVFETSSSQQNNSNDCGVFACLNGLALSRGFKDPSVEFSADDIPHARRFFVANLLNGGFTGELDL